MDDNTFGIFYDALTEGDIQQVSQVLQRYPDAIQSDVDGMCPLAIAVFNNHYGLVELLLERGADVNIGVGENPEREHQVRPIHLACREDVSPRIMSLLLKYNPDLERRCDLNEFGLLLTALQWTVLEKQPSKLRLLLLVGANREAPTNDPERPGETALSLAREKGLRSIVRILERE